MSGMQQASKSAPAAVVSNMGASGNSGGSGNVAVGNGGGSNDGGGGGGGDTCAGGVRQPADQRIAQPLVGGNIQLHKSSGTPRPAVISSSSTSGDGKSSGATGPVIVGLPSLPTTIGPHASGHPISNTAFPPGSGASVHISAVASSQSSAQHPPKPLLPVSGQNSSQFSEANVPIGFAVPRTTEAAGGVKRFNGGPSKDKAEQQQQPQQAVHAQGQGKLQAPPPSQHPATVAISAQLAHTLPSNMGADKDVYVNASVLTSQAMPTPVASTIAAATQRAVTSKSPLPHPHFAMSYNPSMRGQEHDVMADGLQKKPQAHASAPALNINAIPGKLLTISNSSGGSQVPVLVTQPAAAGKNQPSSVRKPSSWTPMKSKLPPQNAGTTTGSVGTSNTVIAQKKPMDTKRRKPNKTVDKSKPVVKSQTTPAPPQEDPAASQKLSTADALSYLKTVKEKFKHRRQVYDDFLQIMKAFKASEVEIEEVIGKVKTLFKDHKELILGFNTFLPKGYEITLPAQTAPEETKRQPVEFDQAINYVNKIKSRFEHDERVYKQFLDILHQYRKEQKSISEVYAEVEKLFKLHTDLLQEFTFFLPDNSFHSKGPIKTEKGGKLHSGTAESKVTGAKQLKKSNRKGTTSTAMAHPPQSQAEPPLSVQGSQQRKMKRNEVAQVHKAELVFLNKVKQRLRSADAYQEFIKCLHVYSQEVVSKEELEDMVRDILRTPELMSDFKKFIERCESSGRQPATLVDIESDKNGRNSTLHSQGSSAARLKVISSREKMAIKPISELDLSNCDRCGPSYRKLPADYPRGRCSGRNGTHRELLNDDWVSITSGQEDNNTYRSENGNAASEGQGFRRNQYEENLFRCEDDRYELDMMIETNDSCIRSMGRLNEKINEMDIKQKNHFRITNELSPFHYRVIERIYGDHGTDIVEHLRRNPAVAVPVILSRVKQKNEEWQKVKEEMNKVWRDIYEKNYSRSLDHRSFHFKQVDKRLVSARGLATEIRDISEKRRKEDIMSVSSLKKRTTPADLVFPFRDITVMYDLCEIVKYCASEAFNDDMYEKATKVYESVVEEIFGISVTERSQYLKHKNCEGLRFDKSAKEDSLNSAEKDNHEAQGETGDAPDGDETVEKEARANQEQNSDPDDTDPADPDGEGADDAEESGMQDACEKASIENGKEESSAMDRFELFPLAIYSSASRSGRAKNKRVLFANESLFVLFRMVQILYERLLSAKQAASKSSWKPEEEHGSSSVYRCYLDTLGALLDGSIDHGKYEDKCRAMLGAASYNLSTLDKVALKLIKQLVHVSQDEVATKLQGLYKYEHVRNNAADVSVYYANACMVLNDDTVFRIDCAPSNVKSEQLSKSESSEPSISHTLSFYLLENKIDKEIVGAMGVHDHEFTNYVNSFVQSEAGEMKESRVYLSRVLRENLDAEPDLSNCRVVNKLECKLQSKGKITYVLDTEDVFVRLKSTNSNSPSIGKDSDNTEQRTLRKRTRSLQSISAVLSPRSKRFRSWLDTTSSA